jgi:hypothetical protein
MSYGQLTMMVYLKVSVSDFLTLFSARAGDRWFFAQMPAPIVCVAAGVALGLSTIFASVWPEGHLDEIPTVGLSRRAPQLMPLWIWLYCIVCWFIQDACKVLTYRICYRYNLFGSIDDDHIHHAQASTLEEVEKRMELHESGRNLLHNVSGSGSGEANVLLAKPNGQHGQQKMEAVDHGDLAAHNRV